MGPRPTHLPSPPRAALDSPRDGPTYRGMSIFAQAAVPPKDIKDLSPIPPELELFARIEGLVGEEAVLLAIPLEERKKEQRERLRAISEELDRIWEKLRKRSERLAGSDTRRKTAS